MRMNDVRVNSLVSLSGSSRSNPLCVPRHEDMTHPSHDQVGICTIPINRQPNYSSNLGNVCTNH